MSVVNRLLDMKEGKPRSLALLFDEAIEEGKDDIARAILSMDDNAIRKALVWEVRKTQVDPDLEWFVVTVEWLSVK